MSTHCASVGSSSTPSMSLTLVRILGHMGATSCGRPCEQSFSLVSEARHFGGLQWYVICPRTRRRVRVLFRPLGATFFASRYAWGRRAAYASQFLDPIGRA